MKRSRTFVNFVVIAVFTAVCLLGIEYLAVNIGQGVPFSSNYTVHAVFADADGVPTAADVRVSGVNVGKVVDVAHSSSYPGAAFGDLRNRIGAGGSLVELGSFDDVEGSAVLYRLR